MEVGGWRWAGLRKLAMEQGVRQGAGGKGSTRNGAGDLGEAEEEGDGGEEEGGERVWGVEARPVGVRQKGER